jgi:energy-coupling factor transporter ATP-binding protein EcfA2
MKPQVIVLDEPTSFLDPISAKRIFEVIHELNRNLGITVVLVEHRLDLTAKYADHIIVMDQGKVLLDGEPHRILRSEETRLVGVGIPKATRLYQILMKDGARLRDAVPLSSDEMAVLIKEAVMGR